MSTPYESADLLLKLYDQRREPVLRAAREWFFHRFDPQSANEVFAVWIGSESASYRMVTTYWEMAASFVAYHAIDPAMFHAANTEYVAVIAKLGSFLPELRRLSGVPDYLRYLETLVLSLPDAEVRLSTFRKYLRRKTADPGPPAKA